MGKIFILETFNTTNNGVRGRRIKSGGVKRYKLKRRVIKVSTKSVRVRQVRAESVGVINI